MPQNFFRVLLICSSLFYSCSGSRSVSPSATEADVNNAIQNGSWTFTVTQVIPAVGRTRAANGNYTLQYAGNKLVVYLPYFGRATGGVDGYSGRGPLDFSTENAVIRKEQVKPGEWHIQIKPDNREVQVMDLTLYTNGQGQLAIQMTNRSPMSYRGYVTPLVPR